MKTKFILILCIFELTSCVSSEFVSYKSSDNLIQRKRYYKVTNSKQIKNFVEVGLSTIYSTRQHTRIVVSFKNNETDSISLKSSNFGVLKQLKKGSRHYFTEEVRVHKADTIFLKYPDRTYTFYLNN